MKANLKRLKEKVLNIRPVFDSLYGGATCSLRYQDPVQLLIATQLAAQCTDARVNQVTPALFARYKTAADFARADFEELQELIRSTGFFRNKAKNIIACCKRLVDVYGGQVPGSMDELLTLAGVGRKTANLVLGDVFGIPSLVIDTHAKRLSLRIGLTKNTDPTKVEFDLLKIVPEDYRSLFSHQMVLHGRAVCGARRPNCGACDIAHFCDYSPIILGEK